MNDANIITDKKLFWESVKHTVYDAINEKRNAVQTALKKKMDCRKQAEAGGRFVVVEGHKKDFYRFVPARSKTVGV